MELIMTSTGFILFIQFFPLFPKIPRSLKVHPNFWGGIKSFSKQKCHSGGNASFASANFINSSRLNFYFSRKIRLRQIERLQKLFFKHLAWHCWKLCYRFFHSNCETLPTFEVNVKVTDTSELTRFFLFREFLHFVPKIQIHLQSQPKIIGGTKNFRHNDRSSSCNGSLTLTDLIYNFWLYLATPCKFSLTHVQRLKKLTFEHVSRRSRWSIFWQSSHKYFPLLMIISNFNLRSISIFPFENNPKLIVYPNRVISFQIAFQRLKIISRWRFQIPKLPRFVNGIQLFSCHIMQGYRQHFSCLLRIQPIKNIFSAPIGKAKNHQVTPHPYYGYDSKLTPINKGYFHAVA